jgi:hypothetical protein
MMVKLKDFIISIINTFIIVYTKNYLYNNFFYIGDIKNTNYINSFLNEGDIFICNNNMKYTIRIIDSYTCHIKVEVYNIKADSIFENLIIYINKEIPSEIIL